MGLLWLDESTGDTVLGNLEMVEDKIIDICGSIKPIALALYPLSVGWLEIFLFAVSDD